MALQLWTFNKVWHFKNESEKGDKSLSPGHIFDINLLTPKKLSASPGIEPSLVKGNNEKVTNVYLRESRFSSDDAMVEDLALIPMRLQDSNFFLQMSFYTVSVLHLKPEMNWPTILNGGSKAETNSQQNYFTYFIDFQKQTKRANPRNTDGS